MQTEQLRQVDQPRYFLSRLRCQLADLVTLSDVQAYVTVLQRSDLAASSQARAIAAIKSLFSFAHGNTGLLQANPAEPVTVPKVKDGLAERIL